MRGLLEVNPGLCFFVALGHVFRVVSMISTGTRHDLLHVATSSLPVPPYCPMTDVIIHLSLSVEGRRMGGTHDRAPLGLGDCRCAVSSGEDERGEGRRVKG